MALVMGGTLLALLFGFRSLFAAVKAIVLNLVSVAASFGALVLVFQDGHGSWLLGVPGGTGSMFPLVPIVAFAIVFGLSMDYEVFLVARVLEARRAGLSEEEAIPEGMARTAGLITSAAAIMIVVFAAFTFGNFLVVKMIGFTLAIAVLIDATLVRIVIGPALLRIAGRLELVARRAPHQEQGFGGEERRLGARSLRQDNRCAVLRRAAEMVAIPGRASNRLALEVEGEAQCKDEGGDAKQGQAGDRVWLFDDDFPRHRNQCDFDNDANVNGILFDVGLQGLDEFHANQDQQEISKNVQQSLDRNEEPRRLHDFLKDQNPKCAVERINTTTSMQANAITVSFWTFVNTASMFMRTLRFPDGSASEIRFIDCATQLDR